MKKRIKYYLLIVLISLGIMLIVSPLRGGYFSIFGIEGFQLSSITGFILYYFFTLFVLSKYSAKLSSTFIFASILAGVSIIQVPLRILSFESSLISFLDFLIHISAIFLAYCCYTLRRQYWFLFSLSSLLLGIWLSVSGNEMWSHRQSFGTFTGKIDPKMSYNLSFQTKQGDTLSMDKFRNKYLLLDFWYTQCGVCYKEMPKIEALYAAYKNNPQVDIYAVHSRLEDKEENHVTGAEILSKEGYRIPCLSIDIKYPVLSEMGISVYPTVLIFDKNSNLIFRGNAKNADNYLKNILK